MRATDVMNGGERALVCGYGDVGKGCASDFTLESVVDEVDICSERPRRCQTFREVSEMPGVGGIPACVR